MNKNIRRDQRFDALALLYYQNISIWETGQLVGFHSSHMDSRAGHYACLAYFCVYNSAV